MPPMNRLASTTQPTAMPARMFARMPTVIHATGLGRSTIYRLVATGAFPPPVHLGPRAVAWRWSDLDRWSESRRVDAGSMTGSRAALRVKGGRSPAPANP
ncbi:MAG: AlpA family phage regulatory protein [Pseudomonadota bacterium]